MQQAQRMSVLGTETAFEVLARAEALAREGRDIINLGIGQPDFKTPSHIVEAGAQALRDGHHGYTPSPGIPPIREAVAADIARHRGVEVHPDRIVVVPGGKVTMFFAMMMFGEPGAEILYPNPGFPIYESAIRFSGADAVPVPLLEDKDFSFDPEEVLSLVTPRTRLLIVNSPANPTGGAIPREALDRLVAGLVEHPHVAILSDEIYARMTYDGREHTSLLGYPEIADRLILLDGWSKTYAMTGWRLGYAVWPEDLVDGATRLAVNCHSCVNASAQYAGIAALEGPQDSVGRDGRGVRRAQEGDRRRAERVAGRHVPPPRRRVLRVPERHRNRNVQRCSPETHARRGGGRGDLRNQLRRVRGGVPAVLVREQHGEHSARPETDGGDAVGKPCPAKIIHPKQPVPGLEGH